MFDRFEAVFELTARARRSDRELASAGSPVLEPLFSRWEGATFTRGLYRIHKSTVIESAEPHFDGDDTCHAEQQGL